MRSFPQVQFRNLVFTVLVAIVLSCVSKTTPDARVVQSLASTVTAVTPADPNVFTFALVGDLHIAVADVTRLNRILDGATADSDSFILFLGDNVDQGERSDIEAFNAAIAAKGWTGRTYTVAGNHDIFYDGWTHFHDLIGTSTYTFTAGNSKFIALDTADATLGDRQTQWLRDELAATRPTHTFLMSHYLPVIPGQETWLKLSSETEALNLMSLASRSGVDAWFGAHYHSFIQQNIGGVEYIVAGGGGARRMPPESRFFYVQVQINGADVTYQMKPVD